MAFDCVHVHGLDVRGLPLHRRRYMLEQQVADASMIFAARRLPDNGHAAWAVVKEKGYEGLVAKNEGSVYKGGSTPPPRSGVSRARLNDLMAFALHLEDGTTGPSRSRQVSHTQLLGGAGVACRAGCGPSIRSAATPRGTIDAPRMTSLKLRALRVTRLIRDAYAQLRDDYDQLVRASTWRKVFVTAVASAATGIILGLVMSVLWHFVAPAL